MLFDPSAASELFFAGLAAGLTILAMTAFISVSPRWLRWLLLACGMATISRYLATAAFAVNAHPSGEALWSRCWLAASIGLTFPCAVALDQLVRHPAMSPKKLVRWYAPFFLAFALGILLEWRWLLTVTHILFTGGVLWIGALLIRKLTSQPIRLALAGLMATSTYLLVDSLAAEMLAIVALWVAFDVARRQLV